MKKFLISLLMLIPLVIIGIVLSTTQVISTLVDLPADKIVIKYNDTEESFVTVVLGDTGTISADIYPTLAKNQKYSYEFALGSISAGDEEFLYSYFDFDHDSGQITFKRTGELVCTVLSDDGGFASVCTFLIVQENLNSVKIQSVAADKLHAGGAFALKTELLPLDAKNKELVFSSSDTSIAQVDGNGFVTLLSAGTAAITVSSAADASISDTLEITVTAISADTAFYASSIKTTVKTVDVGAYINSSYSAAEIAVEGGTLSANTLTIADTLATLSAHGQTLTVQYVTTPEIDFENRNLFAYEHTISSGKLYLKAVSTTLGSTFSNINWVSDNVDVATVADGVVTPKGDGEVTITATADNGAECSISFYISHGILYAWFDYSTSFEKEYCGLKEELVFGSYKLNGTEYGQNSVKLNVTHAYPAQALTGEELNALFNWSSSDESVATVDETGLVTIIPQTDKGAVATTITAEPKVKMFENQTSVVSYTLRVNEGIDVDTYDELKYSIDKEASTYRANLTIKEENAANDTDNPLAVVRATNMQADMRATRNGIYIASAVLNIYSDLIGNGHMLNTTDVLPEEVPSWAYPTLEINGDDVTIDNVWFRGCDFDGGIADLKTVARCGHLLTTPEHKTTPMKNIVVKNCIMENAANAIRVIQGNFIIAGCVIRNIFTTGIQIKNWNPFQSHSPDYGLSNEEKIARLLAMGPLEVAIRNCVLYDCLHLPVYLQNDLAGVVDNSIITNKVSIEGIYKCYNWRRSKDVRLSDLLGISGNVDDFVVNIVNSFTLDKLLADYDRAAKVYEDEKYYNIGIAEFEVSGLFNPIYEVTFTDETEWTTEFVKMLDLEGFNVGMHVSYLNSESDYIGVTDSWSAADRKLMREP